MSYKQVNLYNVTIKLLNATKQIYVAAENFGDAELKTITVLPEAAITCIMKSSEVIV